MRTHTISLKGESVAIKIVSGPTNNNEFFKHFPTLRIYDTREREGEYAALALFPPSSRTSFRLSDTFVAYLEKSKEKRIHFMGHHNSLLLKTKCFIPNSFSYIFFWLNEGSTVQVVVYEFTLDMEQSQLWCGFSCISSVVVHSGYLNHTADSVGKITIG